MSAKTVHGNHSFKIKKPYLKKNVRSLKCMYKAPKKCPQIAFM